MFFSLRGGHNGPICVVLVPTSNNPTKGFSLGNAYHLYDIFIPIDSTELLP